MNAMERQVLDAIDVEAMLSFLCRLIAVPSLDGEETAAQELVAEQMQRSGLTVDLWELDFATLSQHPAYGVEVDRQTGLGLVGALGEDGGGRSLILNGHVDVVPTGDLANWSYPPWQGTLTDRRIYGRGSVDMKGGLCCALFAAKALRDAGVELAGKLLVESVIGEEDGGVGTLATLERGYRADGAVIMEPTELAVVTAQAGALNFRLTVSGKSAHGCVRDEGISAIEKFLPLVAALQQLEHERNRDVVHPLLGQYPLPYPLSIGTVAAGDWPSSVPEQLVCEGRYGVAMGENLTAAQQALEEAVQLAAQADDWLSVHPPEVEWWGGRFESAETPVDHPLVGCIDAAVRDLTVTEPAIKGVTYGADMRLLVNEGQIPTVMFGPGDVRVSHGPDEFVPIDDLLLTVRSLALIALRFCGVAE
jgi:acetylornithine deacetylase